MAEFESIRIGDIVRDMNPTWINYGCKGVVTSINGDYVTWIKDDSGEEITDHYSDLEVVTSMQRGGRIKTIPKPTPKLPLKVVKKPTPKPKPIPPKKPKPPPTESDCFRKKNFDRK